MTVRFPAARRVAHWLEWLAVGGVLLAALLLLAMRLLVPQLAEYRGAIEAGIGRHLHMPVHIEQLTIGWQGWQPVLRAQGFSLHDPVQDLPLARFERAVITLRPIRSLRELRPEPRAVRLEGGYLSLARDASGQLSLVPRSVRAPALPLRDMLAWLTSIESLDLQLDELRLPAFKGDKPWVFRDLRLSLRHSGERRLGVTVELPETLGRQLHLIAALPANNADAAARRGHFYVRGADLRPAGWPLPVNIAAGRIDDLELWGEWRDLTPTRVHGRARSQGLTLAASASERASRPVARDATALTTRFDWRLTPQGWGAHSDWQGVDTAGKPIVNTVLDLHWRNPQAAVSGRLEGRGDGLRIQDLLAIAEPWLNAEQRRWLAELAPTGRLANLQGWVESQSVPGGPNYGLAAEFREVRTRAWQAMPGVSILAGAIRLDAERGTLTVNSRDLAIHSPQWRTPLLLDQLDGGLTWQRENHGWRLVSPGLRLGNALVQAALRGSVALAGQADPVLDVQLDYQIADIARISAHLPVRSMPPKLAAWLERALVSGRLVAGRTKIQGRWADFPFARNTGVFETRFQLRDAILDYSRRWPRLEELEAEFTVRNDSLEVEAAAGKLLAADVERLQGRIADLRDAVLEIDGRARAPGAALLRFLNESPLAARVGPHVAELRASGENTVDLKLNIPLDHRPNHAQGVVGFTGGELSVPSHGLTLSDIQGDLAFDDEGLEARAMNLRFRGEPATLDVDTEAGPAGRTARFKLNGRWELPALIGADAQAVEAYLKGKVPLAIDLRVPFSSDGTPPALELAASSDLEGVAVRLPPPLGKTSAEQRRLNITTRLDDKEPVRLLIDYAPDTQAILEWSGFPRQPSFNRGAVHIGAGRAVLPEAAGLVLIANLPRWRLDFAGAGGAPMMAGLTGVTANIDELRIGNWMLPDLKLQAVPAQDHIRVAVTGTAAGGRLMLPRKPGTPLRAELQRLHMRRSAAAGAGADEAGDLDPRRLPPLNIAIQDLVLDERSLGRLQVRTEPQADGLRLADLHLRSQLYELTASGDWSMTADGPLSRLQAGFNSGDLGTALQALGYAAGVQGGETRAELTASWRAPLPAATPALLSGHLDFSVGPGQLLNVEPGVGRVFGLLNLNNVMRRLRLDFRDLFQEGMSFDRIAGSFDFERGQARTADFILEGPAAHIDIAGLIDLQGRRYDQIITVTPQVGTPLTIAGTIAGGPAVGAAVFLAERLLKPGIDQVAQYQYRLSGSWEDPTIQTIDEKPVVAAPLGGSGNK